ncbi:protein-L-isoaspartate(D-aspartate) O-methyltransferase [Sulfuritortus calidifontis]|uniref:Protein-L-isoaspartate O-methyltransferase n=1 Tax=Sulfuritortus calidifontis TaxID=1914471 RepID=A0A4V2UR03_9PROT|nr:protein-L-isoaspartate(D-aspartate) O-methyltransferase [Sulfuritortus calidifontis]TCS73807.1 protein-L-isoaspartate(D-aspartate) O-methyltransferase [Sulfuritortus calidifontis]
MTSDGLKAMLDDIDIEVELTRHWIGKPALNPRVMAAMAKVPRQRFLPPDLAHLAFRNGPVPIGHGQTISQPYIVALMSDLLELEAGDTILEIGTGSGYQAAVLAELVRQVYTVEIVAPLAEAAAARLAELGYRNIEVRQGDGYQGWPEHAPYDGIIVTAAAPHIPQPLIEQLKPGARLVIPVGRAGWNQELQVIEKAADGTLHTRHVLAVAFVPLTGPLADAQ